MVHRHFKHFAFWTFLVALGIIFYLQQPARATLVNGQNAAFVLGQPNFTSNAAATTQSGMQPFGGTAYDAAHHRLFVADYSNNRVLVYDMSNVSNGMNASYVLGQSNFTSNTAATTQNGMDGPEGLAYNPADQQLFVTETNNNRVLVFDLSNGIANGMNAANVLGQSNFITDTAATTQDGMQSPDNGLVYDPVAHNLFVADSGNSRVLVFDLERGITNGMQARYVLGQPDFTGHTVAITQDVMVYPVGLAYDAPHQRLFVAEYDNARVLVFDFKDGITNGMNARYVLGQSDFTSDETATTQNGMHAPYGNPSYDVLNQRLFVAESDNQRVLVYDLSNGINNGMNATNVLGQPDFTSITTTTNQSTMSFGAGVEYDPTHNWLFVTDQGNNRVLIYDVCPKDSCAPISSNESSSFGSDVKIQVDQGKVNDTTNVRQVTATATKARAITISLPDADQIQSVVMRVDGKKYSLKPIKKGSSQYSLQLKLTKPGKYPYTITANYGSTTLSEKGVVAVKAASTAPQSDRDFLTNLYQTLLHRSPDKAGLLFWEYRLKHGVSRAQAIDGFKDSKEYTKLNMKK